MTGFIVFSLALCISLMFIPPSVRMSTRLGLLDHPTNRKVHLRPVPRTGGWGIVLGAMTPAALWLSFGALEQAFLAAVVVVFLFGLWDDAKNLNHRVKFVGQIAAAALVVYLGDLWVARFPFMDATLPESIGRPFTVFALVGVMNAVNHSDGLDGLAGGECLLSLGVMLALLAPAVGWRDPGTILALATFGSTLGFLYYNRHPARVFMGDSGSQYLGLTLGVLAIYVTQSALPDIAAMSSLLLIGLPVCDLLVTLVKRIRARMSWFAGSRNHTHHRLLDLRFSHAGAVGILWAFHFVLVGGAYAMHLGSDLSLSLFYLAVCGTLVVLLGFAERHGWHYAQMPYRPKDVVEPVRHQSGNASGKRQGRC